MSFIILDTSFFCAFLFLVNILSLFTDVKVLFCLLFPPFLRPHNISVVFSFVYWCLQVERPEGRSDFLLTFIFEHNTFCEFESVKSVWGKHTEALKGCRWNTLIPLIFPWLQHKFCFPQITRFKTQSVDELLHHLDVKWTRANSHAKAESV